MPVADKIAWDEKLMGTGHAQIDEQHRKLIGMINEFSEAIESGAYVAKAREMIEFLGLYARIHFTYEESVMNNVLCPARAANQEAHRKFLQDFQNFLERLGKEGMTLNLITELRQRIGDWLKDHICKVDATLRHCKP